MTDFKALYTDHVARLEREYGAAITAAGYDALVIHGGRAILQRRFDDRFWPIRPTPAFAHWLPLIDDQTALVLVPGERPRLLRHVSDSFWHSAPPVEGDHFWDAFDTTELSTEATAAELPGGRIAFLGDDDDAAARLGIADEHRAPPALIAALDQVRAIKSDYERACMAAANRRAARGHAAVLTAFADGDFSELDLHLCYLQATEQDDGDTPYKNIVALGEHAAVLHHDHLDRRAPGRPEQSLLLDAGATCFGYASDITRTSVRGDSEAAGCFSELVSRVDAMQRELCGLARPGQPYEALHDRAHQMLAPILRDLGVCRASDDEQIDAGLTRALFPHGLGHSIGVQVHDVGCRERAPSERNAYLRNTADIAVGQVFTIEPGCYFIPALYEPLRAAPIGAAIDWQLVAALRPFGGVRIEDDVAILEDRSVNLTRDNWPE